MHACDVSPLPLHPLYEVWGSTLPWILLCMLYLLDTYPKTCTPWTLTQRHVPPGHLPKDMYPLDTYPKDMYSLTYLPQEQYDYIYNMICNVRSWQSSPVGGLCCLLQALQVTIGECSDRGAVTIAIYRWSMAEDTQRDNAPAAPRISPE